MSFEQINKLTQKVYHERAAILVYQFNSNELKQIKNVARLTGIKELIEVKVHQGENTLKEILDKTVEEGAENPLQVKVIVFNNISSMRMNAFIDALKKCRIHRPLIATVTETSINWTFNELLSNLVEEHKAVQSNQFLKH